MFTGPTYVNSTGRKINPCAIANDTNEISILKNCQNNSDEDIANVQNPKNDDKPPSKTDPPTVLNAYRTRSSRDAIISFEFGLVLGACKYEWMTWTLKSTAKPTAIATKITVKEFMFKSSHGMEATTPTSTIAVTITASNGPDGCGNAKDVTI
mmetsp:Transcript_27990/g.78466  ORF Transcript_27990/g.78466 Transcript_27990/m.78466 type:complete len:153 (+) Transcript_27990:125-583(+)